MMILGMSSFILISWSCRKDIRGISLSFTWAKGWFEGWYLCCPIHRTRRLVTSLTAYHGLESSWILQILGVWGVLPTAWFSCKILNNPIFGLHIWIKKSDYLWLIQTRWKIPGTPQGEKSRWALALALGEATLENSGEILGWTDTRLQWEVDVGRQAANRPTYWHNSST